jgi:hypothetical protein
MFNLTDAYLFSRVVDYGAFSAADRKTGIAKSTLAKRVAALLAELGVRLSIHSRIHSYYGKAGASGANALYPSCTSSIHVA